MKEMIIKVEKYRNLLDILDDRKKVWRLALIVFIIGCALFVGITILALQIKKSFTYSDITTNAFGATTLKDEQKEVSYFLFNTAELWANSGIKVSKGDVISVYSSGSAHTAIHHLQDATSKNYRPNEYYFDAGGERNPAESSRDKARRRYRLASFLPQSALVMQVQKGDAEPKRRPAVYDDNFYFVAQYRQDILINQEGNLYFAVNDIVLDTATISHMKVDNYNSMVAFAADTVYQCTTQKDLEEEKLFRLKAQDFLKRYKEALCSLYVPEGFEFKKPGDAELYRKLMKHSDFQFGKYYDDQLKAQDSTTLKTEMDYYLEHEYDQAWYDDNVGSFLIVIEKNYRD